MGYRCLMVLQLAQSYYGDDTILETIVGNAFAPPLSTSEKRAAYLISVPEILEPSAAR